MTLSSPVTIFAKPRPLAPSLSKFHTHDHHRRSARHPARTPWRRYGVRHSGRPHGRALQGPRAVENPPRHAAPRAGRGLHGRRLRARQRPARRGLRHNRSGAHQHADGDGPGARRFGADAGGVRRQRHAHARQGSWLSARIARPARPDREGGAVVHPCRGPGKPAAGDRPRLRALRLQPSGTGAHRNPAGRHGNAGSYRSAPSKRPLRPSRIARRWRPRRVSLPRRCGR